MSTLDPDRPGSQKQAPPPSAQPGDGAPEPADAAPDELLSPLHELHVEAGALFTDFAGWQMPLRYKSDLAEHHAVRRAAGLFDLSHMGEIVVVGPEAADALDYALAGRLSAIAEGQAKYSLLLARDGGILDDLVVYRTGADRYLVVANAANRALVAEELRERCSIFDCLVEDESDDIALIALQGPLSAEILRNLEGFDAAILDGLGYYRCAATEWLGHNVLLARTGYTGEDGFEVIVDQAGAPRLWTALADHGADDGLLPAGLGCRDTLRLEAGMPLYGHELDESIDPFTAGLGFAVKLDRGDFIGRDALRAARENANRQRRVGLVFSGKRIAREGAGVLSAGAAVGRVTSGGFSPTLNHPIAMAYVAPAVATAGTVVEVDIRGKSESAQVVRLPFYRRT